MSRKTGETPGPVNFQEGQHKKPSVARVATSFKVSSDPIEVFRNLVEIKRSFRFESGLLRWTLPAGYSHGEESEHVEGRRIIVRGVVPQSLRSCDCIKDSRYILYE